MWVEHYKETPEANINAIDAGELYVEKNIITNHIPYAGFLYFHKFH